MKRERGLSFEQIEAAIESGEMKGILINRAHPEQIVIAVMIDGYVVGVPATVQPTMILLRTAYYSRNLNKYYGGK